MCLDNLKTNQGSYYNLLNSAFWGWLSMESQPQNPEFRINPENIHQCEYIETEIIDSLHASVMKYPGALLTNGECSVLFPKLKVVSCWTCLLINCISHYWLVNWAFSRCLNEVYYFLSFDQMSYILRASGTKLKCLKVASDTMIIYTLVSTSLW